MMLGAFSLEKSTMGIKKTGSDVSSSRMKLKSLFIRNLISLPQQAHSVLILKVRDSPRKRPCTKGVATASVAQAAPMDSPVENSTRCGVGATVTGYAHSTSLPPGRNKKSLRRSSSFMIDTT